MTNSALLVRQTKKIHELTDQVEGLLARMAKVRLMIICIGGPLNDNKLRYTPAQLRVFQDILDQVEP